MNRHDKAPDPTMEDILASIRRIISDEDRGGGEPNHGSRFTSPRKTVHVSQRLSEQGEAPERTPPRVGWPSASEEGVFNLTREVVQRQEAQREAPAPSEGQGADRARKVAPSVPNEADRLTASIFGSHEASAGKDEVPFVHPLLKLRAEAGARFRQETPRVNAEDTPDLRREAEAEAPAVAPTNAAKLPQGLASAAQTPTNAGADEPSNLSWVEDIQLPIPEDGPVPVLKQQKLAFANAVADPAPPTVPGATQSPPAGSKEEPSPEAVAELAQSLAKSAVVSMEDEELAEAEKIDFAALDEDKKTVVSEAFADALAFRQAPLPARRHEEAGQVTGGLANPEELLPDFAVLPRTEPKRFSAFDRHLEPQGSAPRQDDPQTKAGVPAQAVTTSPAEEETKVAAEDAGEPPLAAAAHDAQGVPPATSPPTDPEPTAPKVPLATPTQATDAPVTQAQFVGSAPVPGALSAAASRSLEDTVREMLRPLLVQWLNDHMPRILESAIREEIASRGLSLSPPKKE